MYFEAEVVQFGVYFRSLWLGFGLGTVALKGG